jgi:hypothetical protein
MRHLAGLLAAICVMAAGGLSLRFGVYGLTIFVLIPVFLGAIAVWTIRPQTARLAAVVGAAACLAACLSLFVFGIEGAICIAMAMPLALPLGAIGGLIAYYRMPVSAASGHAAIVLLLPAATLVWDVKARPPVFEVQTSIEIAAAPEIVWKNVVSFSDLEEPREWYFRSGIAYPKRAHIEGAGVGAVRYCEFSTGPFVEPIKIWNEPRLLRFSVTQNPEPMHEWSPYTLVLPKHLNGYMLSKQGQFLLTRLANGNTLLEGTTWYQHGLWPAGYWRFWSDAIIHRIHLRVLRHIKTLSEA